ncbi:MAG: SDR family NAD(P)-dependent oxidoreductase [Pseudomonadales bacterium]|nr:SDR family NAD(P)-dependent oxidoreductase [Pseudomonadales bacterium]
MLSILITGINGGLGQALAEELAESGYQVYGSHRQALSPQQEKRFSERGIQTLQLDISDETSRQTFSRQLHQALAGKGLNCLINNAGIACPSPLEMANLDDIRMEMEVNVIGLLGLTQLLLPLIRQSSARKTIINIGSISGSLHTPLMGSYGASKAAVVALSNVLRMELKPQGIEVVIVEPGSMNTRIWNKVSGMMQAGDEKHRYQKAISQIHQRASSISESQADFSEYLDCIKHILVCEKPAPLYTTGAEAKRLKALQILLPRRVFDEYLMLRAKLR